MQVNELCNIISQKNVEKVIYNFSLIHRFLYYCVFIDAQSMMVHKFRHYFL